MIHSSYNFQTGQFVSKTGNNVYQFYFTLKIWNGNDNFYYCINFSTAKLKL